MKLLEVFKTINSKSDLDSACDIFFKAVAVDFSSYSISDVRAIGRLATVLIRYYSDKYNDPGRKKKVVSFIVDALLPLIEPPVNEQIKKILWYMPFQVLEEVNYLRPDETVGFFLTVKGMEESNEKGLMDLAIQLAKSQKQDKSDAYKELEKYLDNETMNKINSQIDAVMKDLIGESFVETKLGLAEFVKQHEQIILEAEQEIKSLGLPQQKRYSNDQVDNLISILKDEELLEFEQAPPPILLKIDKREKIEEKKVTKYQYSDVDRQKSKKLEKELQRPETKNVISAVPQEPKSKVMADIKPTESLASTQGESIEKLPDIPKVSSIEQTAAQVKPLSSQYDRGKISQSIKDKHKGITPAV